MSRPVVHDRFSPPIVEGLGDFGPSVTHQEFKDECDINLIMAKALRTGTVATRTDMGSFGDFSDVGDFHEAQNILLRAQGQFAALSSKVRERFKNDPGLFLDWIHSDECSIDEAHDMGLLSDEASLRIVDARSKAKALAAQALAKPAV